jgi:ribosomal protein L7Ae-like RNA K-turn-binding protein
LLVNRQAQEETKQEAMTTITAIQQIISNAKNSNGLVKGIAETVKTILAGKAKVVFLAEDCDNKEYLDLVKALTKQHKVPLVSVPNWVNLKDFCNLGLNSKLVKKAGEKTKEPKLKPRCSSCTIIVITK